MQLQVLKKRMEKYAMPFSSEVNVDVLVAGAPELFTSASRVSRNERDSRRRQPSRNRQEEIETFGSRGHARLKRRESSSQPPPSSAET